MAAAGEGVTLTLEEEKVDFFLAEEEEKGEEAAKAGCQSCLERWRRERS